MVNMHGISHPKNQTRNPDEKNQNLVTKPQVRGKSLWQLQTICLAFNSYSLLEAKITLWLSRYSHMYLRKLEPASRVFRCKL
jgi:hypothetical protein